MVYFPEKSEAENARFAAILDEIHDYLVFVLQEKLGWFDIPAPEMAAGGGHVVIRFVRLGRRMVFRVPLHGIEQLKRTMLAYRHLGHLDIMPEKIYHDGKCIIESHAEGVALSPQVSDQVLRHLATQLAKMHAMPAECYGPFAFDFQGSHADAASYYQARPSIVIDRSETDLTADQSGVLEMALAQAAIIPADLLTAKTAVGHGDLWRKNILVENDRFKIIDWDRVGAYPIEYDLVLLLDVASL